MRSVERARSAFLKKTKAAPGTAARVRAALQPLRWAVPLLPAFAILLVFFAAPMVELVRMSALEYDPVRLYTEKLTLANYARVFSHVAYTDMIAASLKVGFFTTSAALLIGYPMAYYIVSTTGWERTLLSAACLLPIFVTVVVGTLGWFIVLLPFGLTQKALSAVGLLEGPLRWLRTMPGLIGVLVFLESPYAIIMLASSLQNVGRDRVNAARILGASTAQIVRRIMIPLTMPAIVSSAILISSLSVSSYLVPALITGQTIRVLPLAIFTYTTDIINWPFASALAVILLSIVLAATYAFTAITNHITRRGKWELV